MLMGAMAGDIDYQRKLREDFRKRRLHPSTEIRIWEYTIGRPKEQIEMSVNVTMNERLAAERAMLRQLDLKQLEALAAESQAMIDRAFAAALAKPGIADSLDVPAPLSVRPIETTSSADDENASDEVAPAPTNPRVDAEPERSEDQ
jgi:hypothetical protein